jgi:hypothetical protein
MALLQERGEAMSEENNNGADVALDLAGQKINLRNVKSLNTLATIATLILVVLLCYAFYVHSQDARDNGKEFVQAVREQTVAVKEQTTVAREHNCLNSYQGPVNEKADFCKRITR